MVTEDGKKYLTERYGNRYFGWDVEDHHIDEFLDENENITYEELNRKCTDLEKLIRECEEMQKEMQRRIDESVRRSR